MPETGDPRLRRRLRSRTIRNLLLGALAVLLLSAAAATFLALTSKTKSSKAEESQVAPATTPIQSPRPQHTRSRHFDSTVELRRLIKLGLPVYCGGSRGREIALTFDDGPGVYSSLAVRVLERFHARATFFLVGRSIERLPRIARQEARIAAFGDHTWTHRFLPALPTTAIHKEIVSTKMLIRRSTGTQVLLFRPPYAARSRAVDQQVRAAGLLDVLWDVDSRDWVPGTTWKQIGRTVIPALQAGTIVAMHENHGQTVEALRFLILPAIQRLRFEPVTVTQLLENDPPTLRQLRLGYLGCQHHGRAASAALTKRA